MDTVIVRASPLLPQKARVLPKVISGIQVISAEDGRSRLGMVAQLPQNAQLEICGEGFDDRTVQVRWLNADYVVFRQDLEILSGN